MVTWGSSILRTLHICTYCIYIRDKYVLYILYSIYIWLYVCITNKYANAHIMHVADLNWQQSPPKAVLSSGASSKTESVQFTFPLFVLRSISRWTLQWGRFLWTCGCGPSEHAGDCAWTICLGVLEPKVSSAAWPRNRPETAFSAGFWNWFLPRVALHGLKVS